MTALPGWPAVSGAATFQDIRRSLAGQVAKSAAGALRSGILPAHTSALVTGTATMNVAVAAFVAVIDRNGAVFVPNDGSVNVLLSSAPGSGSRWSVVYVKQRESEAPFSDGATGPVLDKVESTTSEAAARALLPAGALELAVVQVNAGAANTNAVGVTITQTARYTAMEGGTVLVRNSTELSAWAPHDGLQAYRLDNGGTYVRNAGAWLPILIPKTTWTPTFSNFGLGTSTVTAWYQVNGNECTADIRITLAGAWSMNSGAITLTSFPVAIDGPTAGLQLGTANLRDASAGDYPGAVIMTGSSDARVTRLPGGSSFWSGTSVTDPFTWANTDFIHLKLKYGV